MHGDFYLVSASLRAHRLRPDRSYVFGREEGVDIVLQDALVSRRHAEMRWANDQFWQVHDLGSRNGVFVNGDRILHPTRLEDGGQVQMGGHVFQMHLLPPGADPLSLGSIAPKIATVETRGHERSLNETADLGATFSGAISSRGVTEMRQFFKSGKKTGRLDLVGGPTLASIWMVDGDPVHATFGSNTGLSALTALEKSPPSRFTFYASSSVPDQRSLQGSVQGILMEVARRLDENSI